MLYTCDTSIVIVTSILLVNAVTRAILLSLNDLHEEPIGILAVVNNRF